MPGDLICAVCFSHRVQEEAVNALYGARCTEVLCGTKNVLLFIDHEGGRRSKLVRAEWAEDTLRCCEEGPLSTCVHLNEDKVFALRIHRMSCALAGRSLVGVAGK